MLKKIQLRFGAKGISEKLAIEPGSVTIFVGPNNSGKSLILREIESFCQSGDRGSFHILSEVEFAFPDENRLLEELNEIKVPFQQGERQSEGHIKYGRFNAARGFLQFSRKPTDLVLWMKSTGSLQQFIQHYITMYVSRFGGKERFQLVQNRENSDLKSHPTNTLSGLFQNDEKRNEVRSLLYEAFRKFFVIDPTSMRQLEVRLSDAAPPSNEIERGWGSESVTFHRAARHISEFSDGVQAFTGLAMTVLAGEEMVCFEITGPSKF